MTAPPHPSRLRRATFSPPGEKDCRLTPAPPSIYHTPMGARRANGDAGEKTNVTAANHKTIVPLSVREILDEAIARKLV